jgi:hypothetical protein
MSINAWYLRLLRDGGSVSSDALGPPGAADNDDGLDCCDACGDPIPAGGVQWRRVQVVADASDEDPAITQTSWVCWECMTALERAEWHGRRAEQQAEDRAERADDDSYKLAIENDDDLPF